MTALRDLREQRFMSQRDLAGAAGVSKRTIDRLEFGLNKPRFKIIKKIAFGLGVDPAIIEFKPAISQLVKLDKKALAVAEETGASADERIRRLEQQVAFLLGILKNVVEWMAADAVDKFVMTKKVDGLLEEIDKLKPGTKNSIRCQVLEQGEKYRRDVDLKDKYQDILNQLIKQINGWGYGEGYRAATEDVAPKA